LNREPWGKAPRQQAAKLKEQGNKYLQQAQPEVRRTEESEKRKAKKDNQTKQKQLQGLQPEQDRRMKTCFDSNEMI
jgi:hypothetical protein